MTTMEMNNQPTPTRVKPDNYLAFAIVSTILFFVPTGIIAIIKASKVDSLWIEGKYDEAEAMSAQARKFSRISLFVFIGIIALYVTIYFFVFLILIASGL